MTAPRFQVGQRVRIADRTPPVHHRVPAYAKGSGRRHRTSLRPARGTGEVLFAATASRLQRIYQGAHSAGCALWTGLRRHAPGIKLEIEIFEHWLEADA